MSIPIRIEIVMVSCVFANVRSSLIACHQIPIILLFISLPIVCQFRSFFIREIPDILTLTDGTIITIIVAIVNNISDDFFLLLNAVILMLNLGFGVFLSHFIFIKRHEKHKAQKTIFQIWIVSFMFAAYWII